MSLRDKLKQMQKEFADTDERANSFDQVPAGDYDCNIYDVEVTESSNGNPMCKVTLAIIDPDYEGRYVWDNIVFTPKTLPMAKAKLAALGLDVGELDLEELEDEVESLRGRQVSIRLTYKPNRDDPDADPWARVKYRTRAGEEGSGKRKRMAKDGGKKTSGRGSSKTSSKGTKKGRRY